MGFRTTERCQCFQHVSLYPIILGITYVMWQFHRDGLLEPIRAQNSQLAHVCRACPSPLWQIGYRVGQLVRASHCIAILLNVLNSHIRVFLTGKDHVDYRKVLNLLFTRKALGYVTKIFFE